MKANFDFLIIDIKIILSLEFWKLINVKLRWKVAYLAKTFKEELKVLADDLDICTSTDYTVLAFKNAIVNNIDGKDFCKERINTDN